MENKKSLEISAVANGYLVRQVELGSLDVVAPLNEIFVFESVEALKKFIGEYFGGFTPTNFNAGAAVKNMLGELTEADEEAIVASVRKELQNADLSGLTAAVVKQRGL